METLTQPRHALSMSDASLQSQLQDATGLVLVDFTADWCPPCRILAPIVEEVAAAHAGRLTVATLDMDANPESVARHRVHAAPTLIFFRDGVETERLVGAVPRARIEAVLAGLGR